MRLAPSAFGGGSPNALLALLKQEVVELRLVYIVRNFHHSFFLLSDDMGSVFINTIMQKERACLSEFGVTNETKPTPEFYLFRLLRHFLYRYQFVCFLLAQKHDPFQPSAEAHCSCVCSVIARLYQAFVSQRLGKRLGRDSKAFVLLSA